MGLDLDAIRTTGRALDRHIRSAQESYSYLASSPAYDPAHPGHAALAEELQREQAELQRLENERAALRAPVEQELEATRRRAAELRAQEAQRFKAKATHDASDPAHEHAVNQYGDAQRARYEAEELAAELEGIAAGLGGGHDHA